MLGRWTLDTSPMFLAFDLMARMFSPYDLNPRGANPLARHPGRLHRLQAPRRNAPIKLFVTATNVHTGRGRVFRNAELTPDVLLASACLPTMFQAIEIDGEAYWDGGYAGNPTITPLMRECASSDTILVQVNPVERPGTPRTAREILNRVNEVSFNATLAEGAAHDRACCARSSDPGNSEGARWAEHAHPPHRERACMTELGYSSKLNAEWDFLTMLRDEGRRSRGRVPHGARRRYRHALHARPRRPARCRPGDGPCEGAIISYGAEGAVPLQGAQERFKREATQSLQHTQAPRGPVTH